MAGIYWLIGLCITVPLILKYFDTGNPFFALPGIVMLALTLYTFICVGAHFLWNRIKWNYYEKEDVGKTTVLIDMSRFSNWQRKPKSEWPRIEFKRVVFTYEKTGRKDRGILEHNIGVIHGNEYEIYPVVNRLPTTMDECYKMEKKWNGKPYVAEYRDGQYYVKT